jgi:hypothetical protein
MLGTNFQILSRKRHDQPSGNGPIVSGTHELQLNMGRCPSAQPE